MGNKSQHGFTFTEVMVAVLILGVFIAGAYKMVSGALWINQAARDHYVAIHLANSRLERARNLQYSSLYQLVENQLVMDEHGTPGVNGNFRRTTTVNANYGSNLTEFVVQVDIRNRRTLQFAGVNEKLSSVLPRKP